MWMVMPLSYPNTQWACNVRTPYVRPVWVPVLYIDKSRKMRKIEPICLFAGKVIQAWAYTLRMSKHQTAHKHALVQSHSLAHIGCIQRIWCMRPPIHWSESEIYCIIYLLLVNFIWHWRTMMARWHEITTSAHICAFNRQFTVGLYSELKFWHEHKMKW